jgi:hypothetical protein
MGRRDMPSGVQLRCRNRLRNFKGTEANERENLQDFTEETFRVGALGFAETDLLRFVAVIEDAALGPVWRG